MKLVLTVKSIPEAEDKDQFPAIFEAYRNRINLLVASGIFGGGVEVRYLIQTKEATIPVANDDLVLGPPPEGEEEQKGVPG